MKIIWIIKLLASVSVSLRLKLEKIEKQ